MVIFFLISYTVFVSVSLIYTTNNKNDDRKVILLHSLDRRHTQLLNPTHPKIGLTKGRKDNRSVFAFSSTLVPHTCVQYLMSFWREGRKKKTVKMSYKKGGFWGCMELCTLYKK